MFMVKTTKSLNFGGGNKCSKPNLQDVRSRDIFETIKSFNTKFEHRLQEEEVQEEFKKTLWVVLCNQQNHRTKFSPTFSSNLVILR